jgi:hypothetical protein
MKKLTYGQQFIVRVVGINCADVQESDLQGCVNDASKLKRQDNGVQSVSGFTGKRDHGFRFWHGINRLQTRYELLTIALVRRQLSCHY